jgi:3-methyladenine DNA glycosylase Mpg
LHSPWQAQGHLSKGTLFDNGDLRGDITMMRIKDKDFFSRPVDMVARELLGKVVSHHVGGERSPRRFRITVTEAYPSSNDRASYANFINGKVADFLKAPVGSCCVFARMILISCGEANENGCHDNILIRGGYNINNIDQNFHDNGRGQPCKFSEALHMESSLPLINLLDGNSSTWIEDDGISVKQSASKPRINVPEEKLLRFVMTNDQIVS